MAGARSALRKGFYGALEHAPALYCRRQARFPNRHPVGDDTGVVIEGYPGSGNSYARGAFMLMNPGVEIASHLHSVAQLEAGRRRALPMVVLIRPPDDAIISLLARFDGFTVPGELQRYRRFYQGTARYADDVVVATFDEVVREFGSVVARVNRRFGCGFVPFPHDDPARVDELMGHVENHARWAFGDEADLRAPRPSVSRRYRATAIRNELAAPRWAARLDECREHYEALRECWFSRQPNSMEP